MSGGDGGGGRSWRGEGGVDGDGGYTGGCDIRMGQVRGAASLLNRARTPLKKSRQRWFV